MKNNVNITIKKKKNQKKQEKRVLQQILNLFKFDNNWTYLLLFKTAAYKIQILMTRQQIIYN